jgi:divalent metal cation (Fe/Co/Zn/Cd) transporter
MTTTHVPESPSQRSQRLAQRGLLVNAVLAVVKLVAGLLGNAYALVADAIESSTNMVGSLVVWSGLRIASRDPDERHRFGYGRTEAIAGGAVAVLMLGAAVVIAVNGGVLLRTTARDLMDRAPGGALQEQVSSAALATSGVLAIEKLKIRRTGTAFYVDLHVQANPQLSLHEAHILSGRVKGAIRQQVPAAAGVLIHMEPFEPSEES